MLNLREFRARPAGLADLLPWAFLVAPGVILNKDGSFPALSPVPRSRPREFHRI